MKLHCTAATTTAAVLLQHHNCCWAVMAQNATWDQIIGTSKFEIPPDAEIYSTPPTSLVVVMRDVMSLDELMKYDPNIDNLHILQYKTLFSGVAVTGISETTLDYWLDSDHVLSITPDYRFHLDATAQESTESWALDRIDDKTYGRLPFDGKFSYKYTGSGVNVYLLDTGMYRLHNEFVNSGGVVREIECGFDAFHTGNYGPFCHDQNGHGTHVAALVGGAVHGVAKKANLISVKVYNDLTQPASLSTILSGLEYVLQQKRERPSQPMVALVTLGGSPSNILREAIEQLVNAGVVVVASAGNRAQDSCLQGPGDSDGVVTVSATDSYDRKSFYSNFGSCTDLYAPGHQITSAWIRSDDDLVRMSGTSMSAALVAGVVAQYLELRPNWTPHEVLSALRVQALRDVVDIPTANQQDTPEINFLLNAGYRRAF